MQIVLIVVGGDRMRTLIKDIFVCIILAVIIMVGIRLAIPDDDYYKECDDALGYKTTYYECRQYHLGRR